METKATLPGRYCLNCGKPMGKNMRKDAKFCKEHCRTAYHNPKRGALHPEVKRINKILAKNFEILQTAIGKKESALKSNEYLLKKGFNFGFYTQRKGEYTNVYTLGYTRRNDDTYVIVKVFESYLKGD